MTEPNRPAEPAVIMVPDEPGHLDRAAECALYCQRRGYDLRGIVVGTDAVRWAQVWEMAVRREVHVIVVPSEGVLPADRGARVESLTQETPVPPGVAAGPVSGRNSRFLRTRLTRRR